ncbi:hypothetical protein M752DRAFT_111091 [Aspergillus phoenicis ATCC 13157]|uniref:Uncharacterized protein n=1 Tax=Aspergillus phoenicis ATCC 13157 TaxID=1353007 RepID=A0A370P483_ASPPH|nr:hypothetical protein M752DRAFT_111091 [Aspergillus phoenicis ATCC 13157]
MRWRLRCTEEEKWRGDKKERPSTLRGNQGRKKRLQSRPCQWARQRNTLTIRTPERGKHERSVKRELTKADEAHKIEWLLIFPFFPFFPVVFTTSTSQ